MPFYFRKSVSAGPFRFNFSKGGVGASIGVKGFRIGTGPRGHYVHAGRGGLYYRATVKRAGERSIPLQPGSLPAPGHSPAFQEGGVQMIEVESGDVLSMRDELFSEVLDEINSKRARASMANVIGWSLLSLSILMIAAVGAGAIAFFVLAALGWAIGAWLDSYRRTAVIFYELEEDVRSAYENAVSSFDRLMACAGKWHVEAGGAVRDLTTWKRNAGASHIVNKKATILQYKLPRAVASNITPPALHVGKQIIYFLPDVALIDDGKRVGAVGYSDLSIVWQDSNFIEEGPVPNDAQIVWHTWKHPNKNGGPDRRFRDNRQIPVCRYEAVHFRSSTGVNELIEFSRTGLMAPFVAALRSLPRHQVQRGGNAPRHRLQQM